MARWIPNKIEAVDSHGEIYEFDDDYAVCSKCGNVGKKKDENRWPKYCDECGAKMEEFPDLEPEKMPKFLNDLAWDYFKNESEIAHKLAQCSVYIHGVNSVIKAKEENDR